MLTGASFLRPRARAGSSCPRPVSGLAVISSTWTAGWQCQVATEPDRKENGRLDHTEKLDKEDDMITRMPLTVALATCTEALPSKRQTRAAIPKWSGGELSVSSIGASLS